MAEVTGSTFKAKLSASN